jgi:XamI restriction endonuclease.
LEQLKAGRDHAESVFKQQRREEGPESFVAVCAEQERFVRSALEKTNDLLGLTEELLLNYPDIFQVLRYFCGPPISEEDLWTLVGGPKFKRKVPPNFAEETAAVLSLLVDPVRFPWVEEKRPPLDVERESAVLATTVLVGARLLGTKRRGSASSRQEALVGSVLQAAGFQFDDRSQSIVVLDTLERGRYSRERVVANAKCDVPVRLRDGRLLAVECKVSNGPKNGWKRVVREVGGKADGWRGNFGEQVVTAVVLAGTFDVSCLQQAQDKNVVILWEHDLQPLTSFLVEAAA